MIPPPVQEWFAFSGIRRVGQVMIPGHSVGAVPRLGRAGPDGASAQFRAVCAGIPGLWDVGATARSFVRKAT